MAVAHKFASAVLFAAFLGLAEGRGGKLFSEKAEWCDGSPAQECKMTCEEPKCNRGGQHCAMRIETCCKYKCQVKGGSGRNFKDAMKKGPGGLDGKGRSALVGEKMRECIKDGGDKKSCMDEMKQVMQNITAEGGKALSQSELDVELKKAASLEAGKALMECAQNASTTQEKKACATSDEVREAIVNATGMNRSDLSDRDLHGYAQRGIQAMTTELIKACTEEAAGDSTAIRQCVSEAKGEVEKMTGSGSSADVFRFVKDGAGDDLLDNMKSCSGSRNECKNKARKEFANSMGRKEDSISNFEMDRHMKGATARRIKMLMASCKEELGENTTEDGLEKCKADAKEAMTEASGRAPTDAEFQEMLEKVADEEALDVLKNCGSNESVCKDELRKGLAAAMGLSPDNITEGDMKRFKRHGSMKAAQQSLMDCKEAAAQGDGNAEACVKASVDKYKELHGGSGKRDKELQGKIAHQVEMERRDACLEQPTREKVRECIADNKDADGALEQMLKNKPADKRDKHKKRVAKDAEVDVIGNRYRACLKVAEGNATAKMACKEEVKKQCAKSDVAQDSKKTLQRYRAKQIATMADDCESGKQAECRREARNNSENMLGFKPRKFAVMQKLGMVKELATAMSACLDDGATSDTCLGEARTRYVELSGAEAASFDELVAKVEKLAEAIQNGQLTDLKPQKWLDVELGTNGAACSDGIGAGLLTKLETEANASSLLENVTQKNCSLIAAVPFHRFLIHAPNASDDEIDSAADVIAGKFEGSSVEEGRRLAESLEEVNSAQGIDEVVVTDSPEPSPSPSPSPPPNDTVPATDSAWRCAASAVMALLMIALYPM